MLGEDKHLEALNKIIKLFEDPSSNVTALKQDIKEAHDRIDEVNLSITKISATMDSIKDVLEEFSDVAKEQNRTASMIEQTLKQLSEGAEAFKTINRRETETGCPWAVHQVQTRDLKFTRVEEKIVTSEIANKKNREELDACKEHITHHKDKLDFYKAKIEASERFQLSFMEWKAQTYKALMGIAFTLVITLIGTIWSLLIK